MLSFCSHWPYGMCVVYKLGFPFLKMTLDDWIPRRQSLGHFSQQGNFLFLLRVCVLSSVGQCDEFRSLSIHQSVAHQYSNVNLENVPDE